jgi:hypothetical protein
MEVAGVLREKWERVSVGEELLVFSVQFSGKRRLGRRVASFQCSVFREEEK